MNSNYLATNRITGVFDELKDERLYSNELRWVNRIPAQDAFDGEIMAHYTGKVVAADIIMNDQRAVVRANNPVRVTTTNIPNIKHGELLGQEQLKMLNRIENNLATARDRELLTDYVGQRSAQVLRGVLARRELLLMAMLSDTLSYDRLGIEISGLGWGMPAELKVTPAALWSDAVNATPIADIQNVVTTAEEKYGFVYDRISMSRKSATNLFNTAEFRNKSSVYSQLVGLTAANFPTGDRKNMQAILGTILGMQVEIDDRSTWEEAADGTVNSVRYLTETHVLLTSTQLDNDASAWDWAAGEVTETIPGIIPNMIGGFDGPRRGPVGYVTAADGSGNPPGMVLWGVESGFPRKHRPAASALIKANGATATW